MFSAFRFCGNPWSSPEGPDFCFNRLPVVFLIFTPLFEMVLLISRMRLCLGQLLVPALGHCAGLLALRRGGPSLGHLGSFQGLLSDICCGAAPCELLSGDPGTHYSILRTSVRTKSPTESWQAYFLLQRSTDFADPHSTPLFLFTWHCWSAVPCWFSWSH